MLVINYKIGIIEFEIYFRRMDFVNLVGFFLKIVIKTYMLGLLLYTNIYMHKKTCVIDDKLIAPIHFHITNMTIKSIFTTNC